jgi:hypothetical protein
MSDEPALDLQALAAELVSELEDVAVSDDGGVIVYQRGEAVFARATHDALELRLPEDIADAALRTPDTFAVPGQPGWVRFVPPDHERHVIDRAMAWFQTAWRHAEGR